MTWKRQQDKPLFEDLLWSKPENRRSAGKLAIIGGQAGQFTNVSAGFAAAEKAGAGHVKALLPDSLTKLTQSLPGIEYAQSNASGSFAKTALAQMQDLAQWADAILLAGDLGNNSETAATLESFIDKNKKLLTVASAGFDSFDKGFFEQLVRENNVLVLDLSQFQKLGIGLGWEKTIISSQPSELVAQTLNIVTQEKGLNLVLKHGDFIWAASSGQAISTPAKSVDLTSLSAYSAVWTMQHPNKTREALATACYEAVKT